MFLVKPVSPRDGVCGVDVCGVDICGLNICGTDICGSNLSQPGLPID